MNTYINFLQSNQTRISEPKDLLVLQEEAENAICSMNGGTSGGLHNIPDELLMQGGKDARNGPENGCNHYSYLIPKKMKQ